jgi:hypothetical protein
MAYDNVPPPPPNVEIKVDTSNLESAVRSASDALSKLGHAFAGLAAVGDQAPTNLFRDDPVPEQRASLEKKRDTCRERGRHRPFDEWSIFSGSVCADCLITLEEVVDEARRPKDPLRRVSRPIVFDDEG